MFKQLYIKENGKFEPVATYINPLFPGVYYIKKDENSTSTFKIFNSYEQFDLNDLTQNILKIELAEIICEALISENKKSISNFERANNIAKKIIEKIYLSKDYINKWKNIENDNFYIHSDYNDFSLKFNFENNSCLLSHLTNNIKITFNFNNMNTAFELATILVNLLKNNKIE